MPGLLGILAKRPDLAPPELRRLGERMAEAMRHAPWLAVELWEDQGYCGGRVHLGVLNPECQPTHAGASAAWFDGNFFETATTAAATTPDAAAILGLIGDAARLAAADGIFNLAVYDAAAREVVLANDRLGFRPLYWCETDRWFAYAGEAKALLAILDRTPDLDEVSLRQFFGFHHLLGDRTWWHGIRVLPPASLWRVTAGGAISRRRYWSFADISRTPRPRSEIEAEFFRLWPREVRRHSAPGTMPLLLSGGLDSRLLLAELGRQRTSVVAVTFGSATSDELSRARRAARLADVAHQVVALHAGNWWRGREEAIWQTDGLATVDHLQYATVKEALHVGSWFSPMSITGDLLFGGSHLRPWIVRDDWAGFLPDLLRKQTRPNPFFEPAEIVAVSLPDVGEDAQGPSSDCLYLRQRYRRHVIHIATALASHCEVGLPGLGLDVLRLFLGALSDAERMYGRFYRRFLRRWYPRYFAWSPVRPSSWALTEWPGARLWQAGLRRLSRALGQAPQGVVQAWYGSYPGWLRSTGTLERLLANDLAADDYLHGAGRQALRNWDGSASTVGAVLALVTFETYLRQVGGVHGAVLTLPRSTVVTGSGERS